MKNKITLLFFLLLVANFNAISQEVHVVKGKVTEENKNPLIGAIVEEYGNPYNATITDVDGSFEFEIPKSGKMILRVTYACNSFYDVLHIVETTNEYITIQMYTKKTNRNTRKIRRKLKFKNRT